MSTTNTRRQFMAKLTALGAAAVWTAPALAQSGDVESAWARVQRTRVLRIGAIAGGEPYYHKDVATGQWQGFMIDLAQDFASRLQVKLDIHETTWGNAVLDLQSNKIDMFFGLNPSPARALVVDFSNPLFDNAFLLIAREGFAPKTWEEMNNPGVKIAVDIGSSHDQMISKVCPNAQIIRLQTAPDATMAVQTGRADAQVLASVIALTVVAKNPAVGRVLLPTPTQSTTTTLGFRKESDHALIDFANKWIVEARASGKVREAVLSNLEKISGLKRSQVPAALGF